jgi:hypothetical protein
LRIGGEPMIILLQYKMINVENSQTFGTGGLAEERYSVRKKREEKNKTTGRRRNKNTQR